MEAFDQPLHFSFTLLALVWTAGMLFDEGVFSLPLQQFMVPVLWFSLARVLFGVVLYRVRVPAGWRDTSLPYLCAVATAAIAGGSGERLSHAG